MSAMQRALSASRAHLGLRWLKPRYLALAAALGLILAYAAIGLALLRQHGSIDSLAEDLKVTRLAIGTKAPGSAGQLQTQVRQAEARLAAAQKTFPEQFEPLPFIAWLADLAQARGVELQSLQSSRATRRMVGQHEYQVTPFTISLRGQSTALVAFLSAVESAQQQATLGKVAQLALSEAGATLTVQVEVYTRVPAGQGQPTTPAPPSKGGATGG